MGITRFTRARKVTVTADYGTHEITYTIPANTEFHVQELFLSATKTVICEVQYSIDGGTTWINPWDSGATHLLWVILGAGIPAAGTPQNTWFLGDGTNTKLRIKITNTETSDATVFYLIKALEQTRN